VCAGEGLIAGPLRPEGLPRQAFEGLFRKALPEARHSRADGPAFLSPARKGWVFCSVGSCGLKVRDRARVGRTPRPTHPVPSGRSHPLVSHPALTGWANESHTGGAQDAVRRKDRNTQHLQRPQLPSSAACCFYPLDSARTQKENGSCFSELTCSRLEHYTISESHLLGQQLPVTVPKRSSSSSMLYLCKSCNSVVPFLFLG